MNSWDKCKNCDGDYGLHHYLTLHCPRGGVEAPIDRTQVWMDTTFELIDARDAELASLRSTVTAQAKRIAALDQAARYARQQLRATSENWREDCLFLADDILTKAIGDAPLERIGAQLQAAVEKHAAEIAEIE